MDSIDITLLNSLKKSFDEEMRLFDINSYNTFISSYMYQNNNPYIKVAVSKLDDLYKKIKLDYKNTNEWWSNYLQNIIALENSLSDNQGTGYISDNVVRNYVQRNLNDILIKKINISKVENSIESDFEEYIV